MISQILLEIRPGCHRIGNSVEAAECHGLISMQENSQLIQSKHGDAKVFKRVSGRWMCDDGAQREIAGERVESFGAWRKNPAENIQPVPSSFTAALHRMAAASSGTPTRPSKRPYSA